MNFGVLIFNQAEELDFVGPWEMVTRWKQLAADLQHCLIIGQTLEPVTCANGLSINPHVSFTNCPTLDYLLVPGGQGTRQEVNNPVLIDFIVRQTTHCQAVLSVCTGSFLLHAAGLLSGKKATTHWGSLERLRELGDVTVVEERYVQDGNVWSSAGVSAGMDLMLAFIASVSGVEVAGHIQCDVEYYPSSVTYDGFEKHAHAPAYVKGISPDP